LNLCMQYSEQFKLIYQRNPKALGMPENWNEGIRLAKGDWIKIMHDDDWFSRPDALEQFAIHAEKSGDRMIFCGYTDVFVSTGKKKKRWLNSFRFAQVKIEPVTLLSRNIIGPPSVVMHRNDGLHQYDKRLRWLVDIDMYVRRIGQAGVVYLPEFLVNVGVSNQQVTASVHGLADVEIPEHFYFLEKTGIKRLTNILVYDYWWRLFRNFKIRSEKDIRRAGYHGPIHFVFKSMMYWQKNIPSSLLKFGLFSKGLMLLHYFFRKSYLKRDQ
jgi:glycosyltransferase involved in cell wall biosynthesis